MKKEIGTTSNTYTVEAHRDPLAPRDWAYTIKKNGRYCESSGSWLEEHEAMAAGQKRVKEIETLDEYGIPVERVVYRTYQHWAKQQRQQILPVVRKRIQNQKVDIAYEIRQLRLKIARLQAEKKDFRVPTAAELTSTDKYEAYVKSCRDFAVKMGLPCVLLEKEEE